MDGIARDAQQQLVPPARIQVLIVEDEPVLRSSVARGLARLLHADVWDAASVAEARLVLERIRPQIVLCDVKMPRLDGMGLAVFHELLADIESHGWIDLAPQDDPKPVGPVVAALPSVTEFSRTSLLAGRLCRGDQQTEKLAFEAHAHRTHVVADQIALAEALAALDRGTPAVAGDEKFVFDFQRHRCDSCERMRRFGGDRERVATNVRVCNKRAGRERTDVKGCPDGGISSPACPPG